MTKVTLTMELAEAKLLMDAARKEMFVLGEELFQVSKFGDQPPPQKIARRRALSAAVDCLFDSISQAELTIGAAQATQPALVNTGDMTYAEWGDEMSELKVFVWGFSDYGNEANCKDFMTDYYSGLAVVIAASESDARDMITNAVGYIGAYGLEHSPAVYELEPLVFISTGKS